MTTNNKAIQVSDISCCSARKDAERLAEAFST